MSDVLSLVLMTEVFVTLFVIMDPVGLVPVFVSLAGERSPAAQHLIARRAVLGLLSSGLALLTGGPGVGKTTIVRCVVALAEGAGRVLARSVVARLTQPPADVSA